MNICIPGWPAVAIVLTCFPFVAVATDFDAANIPWRPLTGMPNLQLPPLPDELAFTVAGPPELINDHLLMVRGTLHNPLDREVLVATFGGNEINPLSLRPLGDGDFRWSTRFPRRPPAPAYATTRTIPANSRVHFKASFDLHELEYAGSPVIRFKWRFGFTLQRPALEGEFAVSLPTAGY